MIVIGLAWVHLYSGVCTYLEFQLPRRQADTIGRELPYYLAFPDSVALVSVHAFLQATDSQAKAMLQKVDWQAKSLNNKERRFLNAMRYFVDGKIQEAGTEMAAISTQVPTKLRSPLLIDRGLLLLLGGFPLDAENTWRRMLKADAEGQPCAEGAWRNLYSFYLDSHDFKNANGLVEQALNVAPKNKWANFAKGFLLRMLDPGDGWENFLREKSSWQDSLFEIQIAYGKFLKERGQLSEAAKYYSRGLEGSPKNGPGWLDLAEIYYRLDYLVFSETCLRQSFRFGIADPYIYELYSRLLQSGNPDAEGGAERWQAAERVLEAGFPHDFQSRSMAQLLYHVYSHNRKVDAAANLRDQFWFHFQGPRRVHQMALVGMRTRGKLQLHIALDEVSFPLIRSLSTTDFYEAF